MTLADQWTEAQTNALRCVLDNDDAAIDNDLLKRLGSLITADPVVLFELDARRRELISTTAIVMSSDPAFHEAAFVVARHNDPCHVEIDTG